MSCEPGTKKIYKNSSKFIKPEKADWDEHDDKRSVQLPADIADYFNFRKRMFRRNWE